MPTEEWVVRWKKNRNHRGEETVFSQRKAINLADEKRKLGYKVRVKKSLLARNNKKPRDAT